MTSIASKADYVRARAREAALDPHNHTCHWPGCKRRVAPAMWGCMQHWRDLPQSLRNRIWATFRPGQEISKTPSREYVEVAREVQEFARKQEIRLRGWEYDL